MMYFLCRNLTHRVFHSYHHVHRTCNHKIYHCKIKQFHLLYCLTFFRCLKTNTYICLISFDILFFRLRIRIIICLPILDYNWKSKDDPTKLVFFWISSASSYNCQRKGIPYTGNIHVTENDRMCLRWGELPVEYDQRLRIWDLVLFPDSSFDEIGNKCR